MIKQSSELKEFSLVFVKNNISLEDFSRQAGIHIDKIKIIAKELKLKETLNLIDSEILAEHISNIKIIDSRDIKSKIESLIKFDKKDAKTPIISILGHIDHGKTTLVDKIMDTHKVEKEAGGITQNISLYKIKHKNTDFFLVDTPGHEIFSDIRKLIINLSDILIILVAGDDGVKAQTEEIVKQVEGKEKIICINKIDKPGFERNLDKIYSRLAELNVVCEEYGGDVPVCKLSAKTGEGVDNLLETALLQAEILNLKTNLNTVPFGYVLDSYQKKGVGLITRILLNSGTITNGDKFVCEGQIGIIKRILVDGSESKKADVNCLIDIIGFNEIPHPSGKIFFVNDDKLRQEIAEYQKEKLKKDFKPSSDIKFIVKAENLNHLNTLSNELLPQKGYVVSSSINPEITDGDVENAKVFKCIFILCGKYSSKLTDKLNNNNIPYISGEIIYEIMEKIDKFLEAPKEKVIKEVAKANVLKVFNIGKMCIAGCRVINGSIKKGNTCRILRNNEIITEAKISSLKREKDNIDEAITNSECGILLNKNFVFLEGDTIVIIEEE